MKGPFLFLRILPWAVGALFLVAGCTDADSVNAAFRQNQVSWFVFDPAESVGLRPLSGFDQTMTVRWVPREQAVRATAFEPVPHAGGAVAVSRLGLLLVDDRAGTLTATRPQAKIPLGNYQTDKLFTWGSKLFLTLYQTLPADSPPATLAWWGPGQSRLAVYPVPSQVKDPGRQAIGFSIPQTGRPVVGLTWKVWLDERWSFERTVLTLDDGVEAPTGPDSPPSSAGLSPIYDGLVQRLYQRLGAKVASSPSLGGGPLLVFTETGWVAVQSPSDGRAHLFRLPDLGPSGRYTGALYLTKGWSFGWETTSRGYLGASGLVHVPTPVLAP